MNVQKVEWALREIQLEFEQEEVGGQFGGLQTERFLALNPNSRVPVLIDGDTVVWDFPRDRSLPLCTLCFRTSVARGFRRAC